MVKTLTWKRRAGADVEAVDPRLPHDPAEEQALLRRLDGLSVFLAGPANVIMQLARPEVGYGVLESKVESGQVMRHPFKRFRTTVGYIGIALFGSAELRAAYREAVNGAHRPIRSGPDSPVEYNAFSRELQLWVASCIFYGLRDILVRTYGALDAREQEVLLRAGARFGTTLQVPESMWHAGIDDFEAYWASGLRRASIDDAVGDYLRALLRMEMLPFPLNKLFGSVLAWVNTGFLPGELREQLGLTWTRRDQRRHNRLLRVIGRLMRLVPWPVRLFPVNAMVTDIKIRRRFGRPLV